MKVGLETKPDNRNTTTLDDDAMSATFDVIVIFPIFGQIGQSGFLTHSP